MCMCNTYQNNPFMMGHPMNMFQAPWSQQPKTPSAPKPKKMKKPKLADIYDEALTDLENIKRVRDLYDNYIKGIEENALKKDKDKKDKDKPKKKDGLNFVEVSLLMIVTAPFVAYFYIFVGRLLGIK